ncbi:hypothetical protein A3SI_15758 [Nitritalea halalkaliphila LW7]|uniref:Uncharacterized protein n=1 Tax=Nitritalea halalkaliphila LW7 TaxID=1189621 RepID=I5BYC6_9BACT|nr:hypothetical protein [Nitritalea halalkaliphila]EIM74578.1 hypothetical protein A3SI_15758 [Nitritalea halalkaliphila LW7]
MQKRAIFLFRKKLIPFAQLRALYLLFGHTARRKGRPETPLALELAYTPHVHRRVEREIHLAALYLFGVLRAKEGTQGPEELELNPEIDFYWSLSLYSMRQRTVKKKLELRDRQGRQQLGVRLGKMPLEEMRVHLQDLPFLLRYGLELPVRQLPLVTYMERERVFYDFIVRWMVRGRESVNGRLPGAKGPFGRCPTNPLLFQYSADVWEYLPRLMLQDYWRPLFFSSAFGLEWLPSRSQEDPAQEVSAREQRSPRVAWVGLYLKTENIGLLPVEGGSWHSPTTPDPFYAKPDPNCPLIRLYVAVGYWENPKEPPEGFVFAPEPGVFVHPLRKEPPLFPRVFRHHLPAYLRQ